MSRVLLMIVALASFAAACRTPRLDLPALPALPEPPGAPPTVVEPSAQAPDPYFVRSKVASARGVPDLRAVTLAISVRSTDDRAGGPGWGALAQALSPQAPQPPEGHPVPSSEGANTRVIDDELPRALIDRGFTKVVYPVALRRILGRVQRSQSVRGATELAHIAGPLDALAEIGGAVPAAYLLAIDVAAEPQAELEVETKFRYDDATLEVYLRARQAFDERLSGYRAALRALEERVNGGVREAKRAYERAGGEYEEPETQTALQRVDAWSSEHRRALEVADAIRVPPPVDALVRAAESMGKRATVPASAVSLRARLVDLALGETFWFAETNTRQADQRTAATRALELILEALGPAPAPQ